MRASRLKFAALLGALFLSVADASGGRAQDVADVLRRLSHAPIVSPPAPQLAQYDGRQDGAATDEPSFSCQGARKPSTIAICRNAGLAALDRRMAEAFVQALNARPDAIPLIRADQRRWIAERNVCQSDVSCLDRIYRTRISELTGVVPKGPAYAEPFAERRAASEVYPSREPDLATASEAVAVDRQAASRNSDLPTLAGLPVVDVTEFESPRLSSAFANDNGVAGAPLRDLTPRERWAKALDALAISMSPDIGNKLDDQDAVYLACIFTAQARQVALFKQSACAFNPTLTGAEFAIRDGATAFRATEIARIRNEALKLPVQFRVRLRVSVSAYATAKGGFDLYYANLPSSGGSQRIFGSRLDARLPTFWPASEPEARAYLATQTEKSYRKAWLGLKISLTGVVPGGEKSPIRTSSSGLPDGATWRLKTDEATLYLDEALSSPLYRFAELRRMPPAIIGNGDETAGEQSPVMLGGGAALLAVMGHQTDPLAQKTDWTAAARTRYAADQAIADDASWRMYDPAGVFFAQRPAQEGVDLYRDWIKKRSARGVDSVFVWRLIAPFATDTGGKISFFDNISTATVGGLNGGGMSSPGIPNQLDRILLARGVDRSQLLPLNAALDGNQRVAVYAAVPQPTKDYSLELAAQPPISADAPQAKLKVICKVDGFDVIDYGADHATIVLFRLSPQAAELWRGDKLASRYPISSKPWPEKPEDLPSAEARLNGGPYGRDMLGVRLGMTMQEAEAVVRANMRVDRKLETSRAVVADIMPPHGFIYVDDQSKEAIALFDWPPNAPGRVVGAWRRVSAPKNSWAEILAGALAAKYGAPLKTAEGEAVWSRRTTSETTTGDCFYGTGDAQWYWKIEEGRENLLSPIRGEKPELPVLGARADLDYRGCAPVMRVQQTPPVADGPENLTTMLFDLDVAQLLSGQRAEKAISEVKPTPPAIKF